jgi:signal transduction histidine kinase
MSLKRYLFLLIVALILIFSAIQLYFIEQVRQQVNEEIADKSGAISQVALSTIKERFAKLQLSTITEKQPRVSNKSEAQLPVYERSSIVKEPSSGMKILIQKTPNKEIRLAKDLTLVTGEQTQTISIQQADPVFVERHLNMIENVKGIELSQVKSLLLNNSGNAYTLDFDFVDDNENFQKIISFTNQSSSIDQYFVQLKWQLLIFTILGMLLAFILAKHISKPLSRLSQGFIALGKGDLGIQLKEGGAKEMRETIELFNQTSLRLFDLQALENKYQQQQQMAELGEVARGLAHTLRNPLNTIGLGISQMQEPSTSKEEGAKIANQIQDKILHLDKTIKTLMHLANADVDRSQAIDVVPIIADIMLEISVRYQTQIRFIPEGKQVLLFCAEAEVRALFHALISNAIEASKSETADIVEVRLSPIENGLMLDVIDHGPGFEDANFEQLFKPHFTTKADGAGMGLFIVKRMTEMHYKGTIKLQNLEQGGCKARLHLFNAST